MAKMVLKSAARAATTNWFFRVFLAAGVFLNAGFVRAQPLTEADVIRLSAARNPEVAVARAETSEALARESEAGLYPNPSIGWEREHFPAGDGSREDGFLVTLPVDLSGRRSSRLALARSETRAASAAEARLRSASVVRALDIFHAALSADARIEVERRSVQRLGEFVRILGRRQEEGTASGFDRSRLEIELGVEESELRRAEAEAEALRAELGLLLGLEAPPSELLGNTAKSKSSGTGKPPSPASIEMERSSARAAHDAVGNARSAWLPVVSIQGGAKVLNTEGVNHYGYLAGLVIDLPFFSRGQDLVALARAKERLASARLKAAERGRHLEMVRATQRLSRAREELARFDEATGERLDRLGRASEAGYREGTRSMTELLDAERTRSDVELRKIDLVHAVRRAEIAVRAARGEFE
jgi:cobalt-zinc-cadmium efflux system outer membrane protein